MQNAIAIRHVSFEDAGTLEPVLKDRGIDLRYLEAGVDDLSPAKDTDLLVVLGGPIGIYEVDRYPFLKQELATIEAAVKKGVPVIGICLGCQALAAVLAARVYPGKQKELGWDEMTLTAEGKASPLGAIEGVRVLNWHGDTFDLPVGATRLASTAITPNQAFIYGPKVLALQFHVELPAARSGEMADRPHPRARQFQGRSRQDAGGDGTLCARRQLREPAPVQRLARRARLIRAACAGPALASAPPSRPA